VKTIPQIKKNIMNKSKETLYKNLKVSDTGGLYMPDWVLDFAKFHSKHVRQLYTEKVFTIVLNLFMPEISGREPHDAMMVWEDELVAARLTRKEWEEETAVPYAGVRQVLELMERWNMLTLIKEKSGFLEVRIRWDGVFRTMLGGVTPGKGYAMALNTDFK
jgi:hypothetical protein